MQISFSIKETTHFNVCLMCVFFFVHYSWFFCFQHCFALLKWVVFSGMVISREQPKLPKPCSCTVCTLLHTCMPLACVHILTNVLLCHIISVWMLELDGHQTLLRDRNLYLRLYMLWFNNEWGQSLTFCQKVKPWPRLNLPSYLFPRKIFKRINMCRPTVFSILATHTVSYWPKASHMCAFSQICLPVKVWTYIPYCISFDLLESHCLLLYPKQQLICDLNDQTL